MARRYLGILVLTGMFPLFGWAQEETKEQLVNTKFLRDYSSTRGFMLGRPTNSRLTPDGKSVLFLRSPARVPKRSLFELDLATGREKELASPQALLKEGEETLTPEEKTRRERMRISVGGFTSFHLSKDGTLVLVPFSGRLFLVHRDGSRTIRELKTGSGTIIDAKLSPDSKMVSYVRDHDVYLYDLATDKERQLTTGGSRLVTHGLAEFVAQEEMRRYTGYWWSPDSRYVVYEEADARDVEVWYVADPFRPERPAFPSSYPRPGKNNVKVRVGILPAKGGETTWIKWDVERFPYLAQVRWEKAGPLTITVQSRDQQALALLAVDAKTGQTRLLVSERDAAWVNLHQDVPRWLDDRSFLWVSERSGAPMLELRSVTASGSRLVKTIGSEKLTYQGLVDVDARAAEVVFRAAIDPSRTDLFQINYRTGNQKQMTAGDGIYDAVYSANHKTYVLQSVTPKTMPVTTVHDRTGRRLATLPSLAEKPPFVPNVEWVTVGAKRQFHASLTRPRKFDKKMRYPVLLHVYGGPLHNKVRRAMNTRLIDQWLADQGFIVASLDGRGTPGRGRDWERAIYKHFGSVPLADQVEGLKALGQRFPEMDLNRVGVFGWSFGGYLSALAVFRRPDVFKAAIAGAPVCDWFDYDTHYTERYLGVPKGPDDESYREGSLLTYAPQLRRPLLIIHGTADDNVYFRHTLKLADALFRSGKDFDVLPLPGLTHMVPDPVVMERLWSRMALFFRQHVSTPHQR